MATRRALIVDDSQSAQIRLRRMLDKYDLETDTAFSAEEALGYLSYRLPAIIFLDHHMKGMDGLEALKIIKSNPRTALVPVVMYTSEKGDVYLSQARALGALDIVSKEIIAPSSIERVLNSLSINTTVDRPAARKVALHEPAVVSVDSPEFARRSAAGRWRGAVSGPRRSPEIEKLQNQLGRQFETHLAKVRHEVSENNKFILRRLADVKSRSGVEVGADNSGRQAGQASPVNHGAASAGGSSFGRWPGVWSIAACVAVALLGYFLWQGHQNQQRLLQQYSELMAANRHQQDLMNALAMNSLGMEAEANALINARVLLDGLSWSLDLDTQVPFGELPWSNGRIGMVDDLLHLLGAANFRGTVYLTAHAGDFCFVTAPSGKRILPGPSATLNNCTRQSATVDEFPVSEQMSVAFSNYLTSAPILSEGMIKVEFVSWAYEQPVAGYPEPEADLAANDWNAVAQKNNRVGFYFEPD